MSCSDFERYEIGYFLVTAAHAVQMGIPFVCRAKDSKRETHREANWSVRLTRNLHTVNWKYIKLSFAVNPRFYNRESRESVCLCFINVCREERRINAIVSHHCALFPACYVSSTLQYDSLVTYRAFRFHADISRPELFRASNSLAFFKIFLYNRMISSVILCFIFTPVRFHSNQKAIGSVNQTACLGAELSLINNKNDLDDNK